MDFIKKHYEKVVLGVVLLGLAGAVVYMIIEIPREKAALKDTTNKRTTLNSKPLPAPDTARFDAANGRLEKPVVLNFSSGHNLFNPVQWQKQPGTDKLVKVATGSEVGPAAVLVTKVNPLYTTIAYESPGATEGTYLVSVQRDADLKSANRGKKSKYATLNVKGDFFTLREVKGTPEKPELTLELIDNGQQVKVSADQPYQRVDGYSADLEYKPENKKWSAKRVGDPIALAGEQYTVAAINLVATDRFEVILSAKATGKKTTIRFNAAM